MSAYKNARSTPYSRAVRGCRVLGDGQTPKATAAAFGVCPKTAAKWVARFRIEGITSLRDRSSRPHKLRLPTPQYVIRRIEALRHQRWTGQRIRTRHLSVHCHSYSPPPRAEQDQGYRPPPAAALLRAQQTWRDDPHRHQEVGTLQGPDPRIIGWHTGMHRSCGGRE